jgi:hypothetical protein
VVFVTVHVIERPRKFILHFAYCIYARHMHWSIPPRQGDITPRRDLNIAACASEYQDLVQIRALLLPLLKSHYSGPQPCSSPRPAS